MARILEALRKPGLATMVPPQEDVEHRAASPTLRESEAAPDEDVPFIEVGGRNSSFEASSNVMAASPSATHRVAQTAPPPRPVTVPDELKQSTVVFCPLGRGRHCRRP